MFIGAIFRPGRAMRKSLESRHPSRRAFLSVALAGLPYIATSAVLAVAGAVPTAPVFFGLDIGNYYAWQMLFVLPLICAAGLIAAAILRLARKGSGDSPGFSRAAGLSGAAMVSPFFLAWVPTAVEAAFQALGMGQEEWVSILSDPGPWQTAYLAVYAAAAVWAVRYFNLAARIGRKKPGTGSLVGGALAAAAVIGAYIVFIR